MSEKRQKCVVLSTRLTGDELAVIQEQADKHGMLVSAYVRAAALGEIEQLQRSKQDLVIRIQRIDGTWHAELSLVSGVITPESTFDGLCERLAERLHQLGVLSERPVITITEAPQCMTWTGAAPRPIVTCAVAR